VIIKFLIKRQGGHLTLFPQDMFTIAKSPEFKNHGQTSYMGSFGIGVAGAKNNLKPTCLGCDHIYKIIYSIPISTFEKTSEK
jgi:hypothetical protein